jgi:hypothetical protein
MITDRVQDDSQDNKSHIDSDWIEVDRILASRDVYIKREGGT